MGKDWRARSAKPGSATESGQHRQAQALERIAEELKRLNDTLEQSGAL